MSTTADAVVRPDAVLSCPNACRFHRFICTIAILLLSFFVFGCANVRRDAHVFSASALGFVGAYKTAQHQMEGAFKIDLKSLPNKIATDCDTLVWYDNFSGQNFKALPHCEKGLAGCQKFGDRRGEAWCFNLIGWQATNHVQAMENFEKSLTTSREIKNPGGEAAALNGLGWVYDFVTQYGKAIDCFEQSLTIDRSQKNRVGEAAALNSLGTMYYKLGQTEKALDYFQKALALHPIYHGTRFFPAIKVPDLGDSAICYDNVGQACSTLGKHKQAIRNYKRAMLYYTIFRNGRGVDWCYARLGWEYECLGQRRKALACYKLERAFTSKKRRRDCDGATFRDMGFTYAQLGNNDCAAEYYATALSIFRELKNRPLEANVLDTLMTFWRTNNPALAVFYGKQAINIYQEIRGNIGGLDKGIQKGFVTSHQNTYRTLADVLISQGRLPEAEQVLSMLKEEEFFDFLRRDQAEASSVAKRVDFSPVEAEWDKRYREIADRVASIGEEYRGLQSKKHRTAEEKKRLISLSADLEAANHAFLKQLDQLTKEARTAQQVARIGVIREAEGLMKTLGDLGAGSVAVYTLVGDQKYSVILVTPAVRKAAEFPIAGAELNRKVLQFRQQIQDPTVDALPLAQELYRILVAPIAKDLEDAKAETLMWSLDGVLRYLPVSALHDGKQFLVQKYRNVVFTPASESRLKDPVSREWTALGLGVSVSVEGFPALPGVVAELNGIIRAQNTAADAVLPGQIKLNDEFTTNTMLHGLEDNPSVVHIASHFRFQSGNEADSFLLLGKGHLTLASINELPQVFNGVELLTLSACNTATGSAAADGKEVESFGMLAQRKGADAVLATLWPVADDSTQILMREFYRLRQAQSGTLKSEALRRAQLELLNGDVHPQHPFIASRGTRLEESEDSGLRYHIDPQHPFAHPYYWAPFILIGNWK